jgi:hypothetical protein
MRSAGIVHVRAPWSISRPCRAEHFAGPGRRQDRKFEGTSGKPLLFAQLAYETADPWSLTSLRKKLVKIGAKVVSHGRYVTFQMAEVAVPRQMFADILSLIARLRAPPALA